MHENNSNPQGELGSWTGALVAEHISFAEDGAIQEYLMLHRHLLGPLSEISRAARLAFPLPAELSLELYSDPEIADKYLTVYIRLDRYNDVALRKIEELSAQCERICTGAILVTTDFKQPQVSHVI